MDFSILVYALKEKMYDTPNAFWRENIDKCLSFYQNFARKSMTYCTPFLTFLREKKDDSDH